METNVSNYAIGAVLLQHGGMHWCCYLKGTSNPVSIFKDHKKLLFFTQACCISQQHTQWVIEITKFLFTITNKKGSLNVLPDLLSCHPTTADSDPEYKHLYTKAVLPASVFINQILSTLFNFPDTYSIQKAQ
ncbi:hypothetical protein DSO57_1013015 [Entomophthora muscae]|uniref:Uncharacterized protein n=1 Tax=Entomophthora muscae TaxID=34485 RepID=A0ACC2RKH8_9FUNG|nr:hypothetical protein DSO57_1013015 [Entomophthora muscae]